MRIVIYPSNDAIIFSTEQFETKKLLDLFHIPLIRYGDLDMSELFTVVRPIAFQHERGFSYTIDPGTEVEIFPNVHRADPCRICGDESHAGGLCYKHYINEYNRLLRKRIKHGTFIRIKESYERYKAVV